MLVYMYNMPALLLPSKIRTFHSLPQSLLAHFSTVLKSLIFSIKPGKITEVELGALIKNDDLQFNSSFSEHDDNEMVYALSHYS